MRVDDEFSCLESSNDSRDCIIIHNSIDFIDKLAWRRLFALMAKAIT